MLERTTIKQRYADIDFSKVSSDGQTRLGMIAHVSLQVNQLINIGFQQLFNYF
jgi:hypothetical protein